jgi:SufS family cysteine desulfurase
MSTRNGDNNLPGADLKLPKTGGLEASQDAAPSIGHAIDENLVAEIANSLFLADGQPPGMPGGGASPGSSLGDLPMGRPAVQGIPEQSAVPNTPTTSTSTSGAEVPSSVNALPSDAALAVDSGQSTLPGDIASGIPAGIQLDQATPTMHSPTSLSASDNAVGMPIGLGEQGRPQSVPVELPLVADGPPFQVPKEIDLIPEPRDLHKQAGVPSAPEGIEHDADQTRPYWLSVKDAGVAAETSVQPLQIVPLEMDLAPSQVVENLPDPPKRPPPQPPSKDWMVDKLTNMSGQPFVDEEQVEPVVVPVTSNSNLYWLPSNSGIKHGDKEDASSENVGRTGFFDVETVRKDFPILRQKVNGKPLVWLDNAATTQKPQAVIDRISKYYQEENSNVHRAAHELAARSTDAYEAAREKMRRFLGAGSVEEIVFTRGTTESINLVAQTYGKEHLREGDEIIVSEMEHHSNIVPWQHITKETGARIVVAPFHDSGEMDLLAYERLFNKRTRMVAITHVSNALGTINPVKEMVATAHRHGVVALIDGAQSTPHFPVDVQEIGADFYVLSSHKIFGPTGVGVLFGKKYLLEEMPPWQGGGNMIESVSFEETRYNPPPFKFEAGTAILAGAVGMGAAVDYLERIGFANAARYEEELLHYGQENLAAINGVKMVGTAKHKAGVMSFVAEKVSPSEMGEILNNEGIAVRTGHHCAQPALAHYGLSQTIRPSLAFYNTRDEVDLLVKTVREAIRARK